MLPNSKSQAPFGSNIREFAAVPIPINITAICPNVLEFLVYILQISCAKVPTDIFHRSNVLREKRESRGPLRVKRADSF